MICPRYNDIIDFHNKSIEKFGGKYGVREENLLNSAVEQIFQNVFGKELYPTDIEKIARLGYSLIRNHPFIDGNKRTGLASMLVTLVYNGYKLNQEKVKASQKFIEETAAGNKNYEEVIDWIKDIILK